MRGLIFSMAKGLYALRLDQIQQVLALAVLRQIPGAAPSVAGMLNLRGHNLPVVDLALLCTGASEPVGLRSRIVVLCGADGQPALGILVFATGEVIETAAVPESCPVATGALTFLGGISLHGNKSVHWIDTIILRDTALRRLRDEEVAHV